MSLWTICSIVFVLLASCVLMGCCEDNLKEAEMRLIVSHAETLKAEKEKLFDQYMEWLRMRNSTVTQAEQTIVQLNYVNRATNRIRFVGIAVNIFALFLTRGYRHVFITPIIFLSLHVFEKYIYYNTKMDSIIEMLDIDKKETIDLTVFCQAVFKNAADLTNVLYDVKEKKKIEGEHLIFKLEQIHTYILPAVFHEMLNSDKKDHDSIKKSNILRKLQNRGAYMREFEKMYEHVENDIGNDDIKLTVRLQAIVDTVLMQANDMEHMFSILF